MKKIWLPLLLAALTLACTVISVPVEPTPELTTPTAPVSDLPTATALPLLTHTLLVRLKNIFTNSLKTSRRSMASRQHGIMPSWAEWQPPCQMKT